MRLDKFLKVSRLIKRRTVANEACDAGRVLVNGKPAKASVKVKVGRCDRDSVRYKNGESRSAGYSGYDQERRGERPVPLFIKQKNSFFRYKIIQPLIYIEKQKERGKCMEERQMPAKAHKLIVNNRKTSMVTGVLDVLSFDLNEILLETEQGMLMVKGTDLHVNRLSVEKGEVDLSGNIDSIAYSGVNQGGQNESFLSKLFK